MAIIGRVFKNQSGMGMVELLVTIVVGVILLGLAVTTFTKQQTLFKNQNDTTNIRAAGRYAIQQLSKDLRMAGYGLPISRAVSSASSASITYRTNTNDISSTVPGDLSAGTASVTVVSATGFSAGQNVVIYTVYGSSPSSELGVVNSVAGNVITLGAGLANAYDAGSTTIVNNYHTVAYAYDSSAKKITKSADGGTASTVVENATGLTFVYRDQANAALTSPLSSADLAKIRKIEITLTLQDSQNTKTTSQFVTAVEIRNT